MKKALPKFVIGFGTDAWPNEGGPPTHCRWRAKAKRGSHYEAWIDGRWRPINAVAFRD